MKDAKTTTNKGIVKGFNESAFMEYLERHYAGFAGPDSGYLKSLVSNLIAYAHQWEQVSKDQFVGFLEELLPELTFGEIAMFIDDGCLTKDGISKKEAALQDHEDEKHTRMITAMRAVGYTYDILESRDDYLRFFGEAHVVRFAGWDDLSDWLHGVVFDDPDVRKAVDRALGELPPEQNNRMLWDALLAHRGHRVEIVTYGDPDEPADVCLEDMDTNEVILDAELYTLAARC